MREKVKKKKIQVTHAVSSHAPLRLSVAIRRTNAEGGEEGREEELSDEMRM